MEISRAEAGSSEIKTKEDRDSHRAFVLAAVVCMALGKQQRSRREDHCFLGQLARGYGAKGSNTGPC